MDFQEVKTIVSKISQKLEEASTFQALKDFIDGRTDPTGVVKIRVENKEFDADPADLKKILDKKIQAADITADLTDLKNKAK